MPYYRLDQHTVYYQMRRSKRVKRLQLLVSAQAVEIIAPFDVKNHLILRFLFSNKHWVLKQLKKQQDNAINSPSPLPLRWESGASFIFQGQPKKVILNTHQGDNFSFALKEALTIKVPEQLAQSEHNKLITTAIELWLKNTVAKKVEQICESYTQQMQLYPRSVNIKNQKRRWGSCGIHNDIYINWLLIFAPEPVLEYVVLHELCHLKYRSHGKRFWGLVKKYMPDYQVHDKWLSRFGHTISIG